MVTDKTGPTIVTAASSDPVTLTEAKAYCRVDGTADDALITALITTATNYVQERCGRQLIQATLLDTWDFWPCQFELDRYPLSSVTTLKYYDVDGTLTTVSSSDYFTSTYSRPPRIVMTPTYSVPTLQDGRPDAVQVTYVAGYASAAAVPEGLKTAVKALVNHLFKLPGPVITSGAIPKELPHHLDALIEMFKIGYR